MTETGERRAEKHWHEQFPPPSLSADEIPALSREEVLQLLHSTQLEDTKVLLIDLRRADHVVRLQKIAGELKN